MLRGRHSERGALDRLLNSVRAGRSGTLVLRGEPGVGKTALLEYAAEQARGCRVARAAGVQSEMELAFAGLHQLCAPMLDQLERLPVPQRDALSAAFGIAGTGRPDPFFVGLAVLGLLSIVAEERPLVCVVDDAQWLDRASAQALGFVSRRLLAESVAVVIALRPEGEAREWAGLKELVVAGLGEADARALLGSVIQGRLDERVCERIVAETRGNPLALLELPRGLTPAELAGGFGLPDALPLSGRIEETFLRRLDALPDDTRRLLLVAAAEPVGEPLLVWRAAGRLGIGIEAAAGAESAGLCEFGARVRFRHPLVRSAVYRAAPVDARRRVHAALAEATDSELDPDRRAWHAARAALGPDERVAAELERSAGRAQARGGLAAAAAFLEQASLLTPAPGRRAARALAAAQATLLAGAPDAARALLITAETGPLDELEQARAQLLAAQIAFARRRGSDAPPLLLRAAARLEPLDAGLARDTYLEALSAAQFAGRLARDGDVLDVAAAVRAAPAPAGAPRASDLLLDGMAVLIADGYASGAPMLAPALRAFRAEDLPYDEALRWMWLACRTATDVWDYETWDVLSRRLVGLTRDAGALTALPLALTLRVGAHLLAGELDEVAALGEETEAITAAAGSELAPYSGMLVAAWRGREAEAERVIEAGAEAVAERGEGHGLNAAYCATAVLCNGLGRYADAQSAATKAAERPQDLVFANWSLVELVEAAVRGGDAEAAAGALERLVRTTTPSATEWALGIEARSRALVSQGEAAERLYREAIERLGHAGVRAELARAHLLYGEWLRRERRRLDARTELRTAHEQLTAMGLEAFAERAARELLATGERARKRTAETGDQLTAQEAQVARLARDGLSNAQIGARLFISPRTVEYHLRKVFTKLEISSRNQLHGALDDVAQPA